MTAEDVDLQEIGHALQEAGIISSSTPTTTRVIRPGFVHDLQVETTGVKPVRVRRTRHATAADLFMYSTHEVDADLLRLGDIPPSVYWTLHQKQLVMVEPQDQVWVSSLQSALKRFNFPQ